MNNNEPLGYFITWTVYGTWLQGDVRGWRRFHGANEKPQPLLADWRRDQLLHPILLLDDSLRDVVRHEIEVHCRRRSWKLWKANPRTNHVHVVATVIGARDPKYATS